MLTKIKPNLKFNPKRNNNLITPCCNKDTKDLKFANFINLPDHYGKCFSCGKTSLPPVIFRDEKGEDFVWNDSLKRFKPFYEKLISKKIISTKEIKVKKVKQQFIEESVLWESYNFYPENNLLKYLRLNYSKEAVDLAKELYVIGTSKDLGTIFWQINKDLKVQKSKISFYNINGKRNNIFRAPFTNKKGFYSCLFGEHLLSDYIKKNGLVVLVESEKTAIVGQILLPKYLWLAYGGVTSLTDTKIGVLIGYNVLIVPDISSQAIKIIMKKLPYLLRKGINAKVWDMRGGLTDIELDSQNLLGNDLEDFFRSFL